MNHIDTALRLLSEKYDLFSTFEEKTQRMLDCPVDDLEGLVSEREAIIEQVEAIDGQIAALAADSGMQDAVMAAVRSTGNRDDLPPAVRSVYDAAAKIRALLTRLVETETQVGLRARLEQQKALEQIKNTNRGAGAQAAKFYSAQGDEPAGSQITKA